MSKYSELNIDQINNDNNTITEWSIFLQCNAILDYLIDNEGE